MGMRNSALNLFEQPSTVRGGRKAVQVFSYTLSFVYVRSWGERKR